MIKTIDIRYTMSAYEQCKHLSLAIVIKADSLRKKAMLDVELLIAELDDLESILRPFYNYIVDKDTKLNITGFCRALSLYAKQCNMLNEDFILAKNYFMLKAKYSNNFSFDDIVREQNRLLRFESRYNFIPEMLLDGGINSITFDRYLFIPYDWEARINWLWKWFLLKRLFVELCKNDCCDSYNYSNTISIIKNITTDIHEYNFLTKFVTNELPKYITTFKNENIIHLLINELL